MAVIRTAIVRTGASGTWSILDDADHSPTGFTAGSGISQDSGAKTITLTYDDAITGDIYGALASPDETLVQCFDFGISVGKSTAVITIRAKNGATGRVYRTGGSWTFDVDDGTGNTWTPTGWQGADDRYRLDNVPNWLNAHGAVISPMWGSYVPDIDNTSNTNDAKLVDVEFRDYSGALQTTEADNMAFTIFIPPLHTDLDPAHINNTDFASANIWVEIFSAD